MNGMCQECGNRTDRLKAKRPQRLKVTAALTALVALSILGSLTAVFAEDTTYTEARLEGDYGFVRTYAGDVARLVGTAYFDGKGNLTSGSARVVIVGGTVKPITYTGVYTINPDGTGSMTITVFGVATPPPMVHEDFVITKAHFINGIKIATEVQDAQEEPSVIVSTGSGFVTHVYTRRPDHQEHR
jgi:hypothetical protein